MHRYNDAHLPSHPQDIKTLLKFVKRFGCRKVIDLGSGDGHVLEALALEGHEPYGIDTEQHCIDATRERFDRAGLPAPQLITGTYFNLKDHVFPDGSAIGDMDFFYCYSYRVTHAHKVFKRVLTGEGASVGSYAWIRDLPMGLFGWEFRQAGFVPAAVFSPVMRKFAEREVAVNVRIRQLRYEVNCRPMKQFFVTYTGKP